MPASITPTQATATTTVETPFTADAVWIDRTTIDASKRLAATPSLDSTLTPYLTTDGTFAADSVPFKASDIYAVARNIPEFGQWVLTGFAAGTACWRWKQARKADLDAATATLTTATTAEATAKANVDSTKTALDEAKAALDATKAAGVTAAKATLDAAETARTAAYKARSSETDSLWTNADAAWKQATADYNAAQAAPVVPENDAAWVAANAAWQQATAALTTAQAATAKAREDVATAQAAHDDASKPPLLTTPTPSPSDTLASSDAPASTTQDV